MEYKVLLPAKNEFTETGYAAILRAKVQYLQCSYLHLFHKRVLKTGMMAKTVAENFAADIYEAHFSPHY